MEQTGQFMTLHDASRNVSTPARSLLASLQLVSTCSDPVAADLAAILIGCYRKGEAHDPDIYVAAIAAVLASYPEPVARRVTDPRTGLPGTSEYLPSVPKVKAACEREMEPLRAQIRRDLERERSQAIHKAKPTVSAERRKALADELRQKFAQHAAALAADYALRPPVLSEALRATLTPRTGAQKMPA